MELEALRLVLDKVRGATFATIDSTTSPTPGIKKVTRGTRVIIFSGTEESGYEAMVKRRLEEAGKDPSDFTVSDLPWGERIPNTPLITCRGNVYLQTIVLEPGQSVGYCGNREVSLDDFVPSRRTNQGLPKKDEVVVSTYKLENIDRISLMGEVLTSEGRTEAAPVIGDKRGIVPLGA